MTKHPRQLRHHHVLAGAGTGRVDDPSGSQRAAVADLRAEAQT